MLDENLPTFFFKQSSDNEHHSTILLGQSGNDLTPEYTLKRPDPKLPASKNCYAVALYDSYNPEVLFAEVLVSPEWTQPTLSQAEIRSQNGIPPPPVPIVPNQFTIQLYNPDQQVTIRQIAGSWNSSAYWEFEMPINTFRLPSDSALDRSQSDPSASDVTPKVAFKWKRDGKLSKDIACYLSGRSTNGKKSKEPDILLAMFKHGKEMTIYQPNMNRVEVEDIKGLEVVFLLGATAIKDVFFNPSRELFNISGSAPPNVRKNSGGLAGVMGGKSSTSPPGAQGFAPPPRILSSQIPPRPQASSAPAQASYSRPPPADPRTQWEIDAETARLRAAVEAEEMERERADKTEQKRIKKMLEAEEKERKRQEAEVKKETERLRRLFGTQPTMDNGPSSAPSPIQGQGQGTRVHFTPPLPPRPVSSQGHYGQQQYQSHQSQPYYNNSPPQQQQQFPQYTPGRVQRPQSTPSGPTGRPHASSNGYQSSSYNSSQDYGMSATSGPFDCPTINSWIAGPSGGKAGSAAGATMNALGNLGDLLTGGHGSGSSQQRPNSGPYLQAPGGGQTASHSGFFGGSGTNGKKVQKKRSVFF